MKDSLTTKVEIGIQRLRGECLDAVRIHGTELIVMNISHYNRLRPHKLQPRKETEERLREYSDVTHGQ